MKTFATVALLTAAGALLAPAGAAAQGSNQGSYAAQLVPGAIAGKVTSRGAPVPGARVETVDGQFATSNASGDYVLYVDATGLYTVRVTSGPSVAGPVQASVALGATTTLNFTSLRVLRRPHRRLPASSPPPPPGPQR